MRLDKKELASAQFHRNEDPTLVAEATFEARSDRLNLHVADVLGDVISRKYRQMRSGKTRFCNARAPVKSAAHRFFPRLLLGIKNGLRDGLLALGRSNHVQMMRTSPGK